MVWLLLLCFFMTWWILIAKKHKPLLEKYIFAEEPFALKAETTACPQGWGRTDGPKATRTQKPICAELKGFRMQINIFGGSMDANLDAVLDHPARDLSPREEFAPKPDSSPPHWTLPTCKRWGGREGGRTPWPWCQWCHLPSHLGGGG